MSGDVGFSLVDKLKDRMKQHQASLVAGGKCWFTSQAFVSVNTFFFLQCLPLQCFNTVGWVTGKASGLPKISPHSGLTRGQCDVRPTVTLPTTRYHRTLAGTKLYCLVTEAHVCVNLTCPGLHSTVGRLGFKPATY